VLAAEDDAADPATGANAANKLASDPQVAAVVGTLNSSVAQSVAPVLAKANITQISPANTNPTLTRGPKPDTDPKRVWPTYMRVATTDAFQGPFAADYALDEGGFKSAFVIHDKKTYGQGLAEAFAKRFEEKGGTIAGRETVNPGDRDFGAVVTQVIGSNADLVYYGGEYPAAGPLAAQLKERGFKGPLMGGDGIYASDFFKGAGDKGEGTLATSIGEPVSELETAQQFVKDYEAAGFKESYSAYGAQSYDAANIIIQGLAKVLPNAQSVEAARPQIVEAISATSGYQGVTGEHTFDEYGDTSNRALTVYKATGKDWTPEFSGAFET
jgi:branched-chain amino acid transport system substrate-binding protein